MKGATAANSKVNRSFCALSHARFSYLSPGVPLRSTPGLRCRPLRGLGSGAEAHAFSRTCLVSSMCRSLQNFRQGPQST